ncbi:tRNA preQ1(34) S-adenosylmethionine ribosyltransferase-isomerase QueA [Hellea balneolensis]|uniref:tRNA preQ1(34) S-adenosylmethionine ribosyltransferase-isomerase QueA n=1 Tax=Hellea balneolensis TaxID=287478 RepID=UPI00041BB10F|nr:tRNA preQ1(34) S-adenosylmethionine ribosyltransferase-isomerase QueA [Hellea balneolensis]
MKVSAFDFHLPEESIALRPASPRDSAKLLRVSGQGEFSDHIVSDLPSLLRKGDVLVLNETKVLRAALRATRPARAHGGGGDVTVDVNLHTALSENEWRAFVRPAKRLRDGDEVHFSDSLSATVFGKQDGGDVGLRFNLSGTELSSSIEAIGQPPLPPYIARKRTVDAQDIEDYQTVYADGKAASVAAPTAGLHFTPEVFKALEAKSVQIERLMLHVGAGTFLPVKADDTDEHHMHSEWYQIAPETAARINTAKGEGRRIIAVGTTALRALESSAVNGRVKNLTADTQIFITPGSQFYIIDGLMTNFHLPKSTLFMLVSALAGLDTMQDAYAHAIKTGYRFYSYGDSSLLWAAEK